MSYMDIQEAMAIKDGRLLRNHHKNPIYNGVVYDSDEEVMFVMWLEEAEKAGVIESWLYHCETYTLSNPVKYNTTKQLKTKVKIEEKHLINGCEYTPDFKFIVDKKYFNLFKSFGFKVLNDDSEKYVITVDVKGMFDRHGGTREFEVKRKWLHQTNGIYVHKIVPEKLFKKSFVPDLVRKVFGPKTSRGKNKFRECKSIKELEHAEKR